MFFSDTAGCILDNTSSAGEHVCTWLQIKPLQAAIRRGPKSRTKWYTSSRRARFGTISEATSRRPSILRTSTSAKRLHTGMSKKKKGYTLVEVSLYMRQGRCLSPKTAEGSWSKTLWTRFPRKAKVRSLCNLRKDSGRTWQRSWTAVSLFADRPQNAIYVAWGVHTKTNRVQGVVAK